MEISASCPIVAGLRRVPAADALSEAGNVADLRLVPAAGALIEVEDILDESIDLERDLRRSELHTWRVQRFEMRGVRCASAAAWQSRGGLLIRTVSSDWTRSLRVCILIPALSCTSEDVCETAPVNVFLRYVWPLE